MFLPSLNSGFPTDNEANSAEDEIWGSGLQSCGGWLVGIFVEVLQVCENLTLNTVKA